MAGDTIDGLIVKIMAKVFAPIMPVKEVQELIIKLPAAVQDERDALRPNAAQQAFNVTSTPANAVAGAENVMLEAELEQQRAANVDLKAALTEANAELNEAKSKNRDLQSKVDRETSSNDELNKLRSMSVNLKTDIQSMQRELNGAARDAVAKPTKRIRRLRSRNNAITSGIKRLEQSFVKAGSNAPQSTHAVNGTGKNYSFKSLSDKASQRVDTAIGGHGQNLPRATINVPHQPGNASRSPAQDPRTYRSTTAVSNTARLAVRPLAPAISTIEPPAAQRENTPRPIVNLGSRPFLADDADRWTEAEAVRQHPRELAREPVKTVQAAMSEPVRAPKTVVTFGSTLPSSRDPRTRMEYVLTSTSKRPASEEVLPVAVKKAKLAITDHDGASTLRAAVPASTAPSLAPGASFSAPSDPVSAPNAPASLLRVGPVCHPCRQDHQPCNAQGPCGHCKSTAQVCLYLPCPWGIYCKNPTCGYLHKDQEDPWVRTGEWPGGLAAFHERMRTTMKRPSVSLLHLYRTISVSNRVQEIEAGWKEFMARHAARGTSVSRAIVLD